ncbi:hypothetical protein K9L67_03240 [Candidatus Woesearchaeota archaeon]|nr:hypothetical protein [Candidatus Woesearchaeota archaeon]MCF7901216.1 hypothetical protein [Candidatus Woesearchaeota archaeon]MCF8013745.1 hypothetical protein [Candidatus Woesearchaeota archaeon]
MDKKFDAHFKNDLVIENFIDVLRSNSFNKDEMSVLDPNYINNIFIYRSSKNIYNFKSYEGTIKKIFINLLFSSISKYLKEENNILAISSNNVAHSLSKELYLNDLLPRPKGRGISGCGVM